MKPKEFDELVRQKFDRNDFAYDPKNWDKLAEKLEGKEKKRNIIAWWWVPLAGMAASVALAFGVSSLLRQQMPGNISGSMAKIKNEAGAHQHNAQPGSLLYTPGSAQNETTGDRISDATTANNTYAHKNDQHKHSLFYKHTPGKIEEENEEDQFGINLKNAISNAVVWQAKKIDLTKATIAANKEKEVATKEAINTFMPVPEEEQKPGKAPKLSVILSGGYSHGNQNTGYMAGGTIRRMINDKVYVESDVALASSTNTQSTEYLVGQVPVNGGAARNANTARTTGVTNTTRTTSVQVNKAPQVEMEDVIGQKNISYDLYYAQVSPSLGYKVIKRMSVGVGPDFQKVLADNRPAPSTVDRGNIQVMPLFDVGFIGKTEYALTRKVKAGVYYRKGINNIITPMDKYIERDYLQFQVKYTIFNK